MVVPSEHYLPPDVGTTAGREWFCLRTQPKHEHIAAANLVADAGVEVFLPRVRFRRRTRTGPQWVTEALFPSYLFACFELSASLRQVQHVRGVRGVVHFGLGWPTVPAEVIGELRLVVGEPAVRVLPDEFVPGEEVQVVAGAFAGLEAVVSRYLPARQRVAVLLEFLGRQTLVELPQATVVKPGDRRREILP
jgi:transcriptional antiterminator RfaH